MSLKWVEKLTVLKSFSFAAVSIYNKYENTARYIHLVLKITMFKSIDTIEFYTELGLVFLHHDKTK